MKFNLKGWKKVKSEKTHTILKNKDDHELKISHKGISKAMHAELDKLPHLASGGDVANAWSYEDKAKFVKVYTGAAPAAVAGTGSDSGSMGGTSPRPLNSFQPDPDSAKAPSQYAGDYARPVVDTSVPTDTGPAASASDVAAARAHLSAMAEGGKVQNKTTSGDDDNRPSTASQDGKTPQPNFPSPKDPDFGSQPNFPQPKYVPTESKGGRVRYADGGDVSSSSPQAPVTINIGGQGGMNPNPPSNDQIASALHQGEVTPNENPSNQIPQQGGSPQPQAQPPSQTPQNAPQSQSTPSQVPNQQGMPQQPLQPTPDPMAGYQLGQQAIALGAQNESTLSKQQAQNKQQQVEGEQDILGKSQEFLSHMVNDSKNLMEDIKTQHIDPNNYLGSMDTSRRIETGIGLFLGGIGAGITGGPNQALAFLNNQIDRDIDAQKASLGQKQSLLSANMNIYHNALDAENVTRAQIAHIAGTQAEQQAAALGSPIAKQRALMLQSDLQSKYFPLLQQSAMRQAIYSVNGGSDMQGQKEKEIAYLATVNPAAADRARELLVPGVIDPRTGQTASSTIKVPDGVREKLVDQTNLVNATQKLRSWVKENGSVLDKLSPAKRAEGETYAAELQQLYRQGVGASTSENEQKVISDSIIPSSPSGLLAQYTVDPKLKALEESQVSRLNGLKKAYNIPQDDMKPKLTAQQQKFADFARANPNDPRSALILKKLGQ